MPVRKLIFVTCAFIFITIFATGCSSNDTQRDNPQYYNNQNSNSPGGVQPYELYEPAPPRITALTGNFYFSSYKLDGTGADFPARFFWDEAYFSNPASKYNPSLATMTLAFAMSAFASNEYGIGEINQARNAIDLLTQIGFKDIDANHYFATAPHEDSIGVIAAHKTIEANGETYTLIAVSTRGSGYGMEWAGNFTVGTLGYHEGFNRAANETYRFVSDYVHRHRDIFHDNIKLWITGYSRGGAVANMFAAWVTQAGAIGDISIEKENIFAYTFGTPRAVPASHIENRPVHTNIHNVLSPADIVTWVAPQIWGFGRYGVDHFIPERGLLGDPAAFDNMVRVLYDLDAGRARSAVIVEDGQLRHITQDFIDVRFSGVNIFPLEIVMTASNALVSPFLLELTNNLAEGVMGQDNYAEILEELLRGLVSVGLGEEGFDGRIDLIIELFMSRLGLQNALEIAMAFAADGVIGLTALAAQYLYESMIEAGVDVDGGFILGDALINAFVYIGLDGALTLLHNMEPLAAAHHPEFMLAWLMSQDSNFGGAATEFVPVYRKLSIRGPADINVYNNYGVLAAQFVDNKPMDVGSHIVVSLGANEEMIVYLPADTGYTLEMTATGPGELDFIVMDFCFVRIEYSLFEGWQRDLSAIGDIISVEILQLH